MRKTGFGLLGYGAWGKGHARAIEETHGARLRAVAAHSSESRNAAAQETKAAVVDGIEALVSRPDVDVRPGQARAARKTEIHFHRLLRPYPQRGEAGGHDSADRSPDAFLSDVRLYA